MPSESRKQPWWLFAVGVIGVVAIFLLLRNSGEDGAGSSTTVVKQSEPAASGSTAPDAPAAADPAPVGDQTAAEPATTTLPLPSGGWDATGRVVSVEPNVDSNQPPGTVLERPWSFEEVCQETCKVVFSRMTLYGLSVTWLLRRDNVFVAKFPPVTVPCSYPRGSSYPRHVSGESHDEYELWWSDDGTRLESIEHRVQTGCYPPPNPPDVTRWEATPIAGEELADQAPS